MQHLFLFYDRFSALFYGQFLKCDILPFSHFSIYPYLRILTPLSLSLSLSLFSLTQISHCTTTSFSLFHSIPSFFLLKNTLPFFHFFPLYPPLCLKFLIHTLPSTSSYFSPSPFFLKFYPSTLISKFMLSNSPSFSPRSHHIS